MVEPKDGHYEAVLVSSRKEKRLGFIFCGKANGLENSSDTFAAFPEGDLYRVNIEGSIGTASEPVSEAKGVFKRYEIISGASNEKSHLVKGPNPWSDCFVSYLNLPDVIRDTFDKALLRSDERPHRNEAYEIVKQLIRIIPASEN